MDADTNDVILKFESFHNEITVVSTFKDLSGITFANYNRDVDTIDFDFDLVLRNPIIVKQLEEWSSDQVECLWYQMHTHFGIRNFPTYSQIETYRHQAPNDTTNIRDV